MNFVNHSVSMINNKYVHIVLSFFLVSILVSQITSKGKKDCLNYFYTF